jgi:hypothetical protein
LNPEEFNGVYVGRDIIGLSGMTVLPAIVTGLPMG